MLQEVHVREFSPYLSHVVLGNSSAGQSAEQSLATPNATANAGNVAGATRHEASMLRMVRMVIVDLGHDWFGSV